MKMIKKFDTYLIDIQDYHLNEKMGVSDDGEILSDFLINFLSEVKPGLEYIFVRPDNDRIKPQEGQVLIKYLPELEKNVSVVIVNYSKENFGSTQAFFDPMRSRYTKYGYMLFFTFFHKKDKDKIWKHYIYHEIHHGVQFMHMGKKKMKSIPKNIKIGIFRNFKMGAVYNIFIDYLYHTIDIEQGALVAEFYGKLKYRKNINNIDDLKEYFKKRDVYEYEVAKKLAKCDLINLFNMKVKNHYTGEIVPITTKKDMIIFFSLLKKIGKDIFRYKEDYIKELIKNNKIELKDQELISEEELEYTIKNYNEYFNEVGKKLLKKLDKTYPLLLDYFTKKFNEKEDKMN